jgi:hypothetical protein
MAALYTFNLGILQRSAFSFSRITFLYFTTYRTLSGAKISTSNIPVISVLSCTLALCYNGKCEGN